MTDLDTASRSSSTSQTVHGDHKRDSHNSTTTPSNHDEKLLMEEIAAIPIQQIESIHAQEEADGKKKKKKEKKEKQPAVPIYKIFRFATKIELLMILIAAIFSAGIFSFSFFFFFVKV